MPGRLPFLASLVENPQSPSEKSRAWLLTRPLSVWETFSRCESSSPPELLLVRSSTSVSRTLDEPRTLHSRAKGTATDTPKDGTIWQWKEALIDKTPLTNKPRHGCDRLELDLRGTHPQDWRITICRSLLLNKSNTQLCPITNSSPPTTSLISLAILTTMSCSVPACWGCDSLHLVTMLAVLSRFCIMSIVTTWSPRKKWSGSESFPSRSHSSLVNSLSKKPSTGGLQFHGRRRWSYESRDRRLPGSSYGAMFSRFRRMIASWTLAAFGVAGSARSVNVVTFE